MLIAKVSFSMCAVFSEKLTVLTPTLTCAYQGLKSVTFSENILYILNELSLNKMTPQR